MGCIDSKSSHPLTPPPSATQVNGTLALSGINLQVGDTSRPLPSTPLKKERLYYRALYDFDAINDDDLSFKKGDKLEVDEEASQNCDWWVATHTVTKRTGYIPSNYVAKDDNSPQAQDWWNNLDRKEADKQLLLPGNPTGTFLVREAGDKASFVLSVRDHDQKLNDACVKHYRIRRMDDGGYYISPKRTFRNMLDLIQHYQSSMDGLCCQLLIACPKVRPLVQFRELEVNRESVKLQKKLGSGCFGDVYAGKWRNTVDVAVKTLKPGQMTAEDFLREAELMHKLRHRKLVQLLAVCTKSEPIWIITELMVHGALLDYLRKDEGKLIKFKEICDMAAQIADGMAYLETENFVHRDLRAANILVGENNDVKVADFGLARLIQEEIYEAHEIKNKFSSLENGSLLMPSLDILSQEHLEDSIKSLKWYLKMRRLRFYPGCSALFDAHTNKVIQDQMKFLYLAVLEHRMVATDNHSETDIIQTVGWRSKVIFFSLYLTNISYQRTLFDLAVQQVIQLHCDDEDTKFPIKWTAPEAAFDRKFSIKSDIWSFGVLLYELVSFGRVPYPGMSGHEVLSKVEKGYRMPKPAGGPVPVPDAYYDTMLKCWNRVPESRPTFAYLQDFFDNFFVAAEGEYQ